MATALWVTIAAALPFAFGLNFAPKIDYLAQGTPDVPCGLIADVKTGNRSGYVAESRSSACEIGPLAGQDMVVSIVAVYPAGGRMRESDVIFRSEDGWDGEGNNYLPTVRWRSTFELLLRPQSWSWEQVRRTERPPIHVHYQ